MPRRLPDAGASSRWTPGTRRSSISLKRRIAFTGASDGKLVFGALQGFLDVRYGSRDGSACAEFSWEGQDETIPPVGEGGPAWEPPDASWATSTFTKATT